MKKNKYALDYYRRFHLHRIRKFPPAKPKRFKYLYSKMLKEETIIAAWMKLRKGKTNRIEVKIIEEDFDNYVQRMKEMILNTKPVPVDHPELGYEPPVHRKTKIVNERGKARLAYMAEIWEQWYFHVIVVVLQPIVMRRLHMNSYGSIPGRGPHSGKRHIENIITEGFVVRDFLKFDIRHFYDSIQISVMLNKLREDIEDEWFIHCIAQIYKHVKKGIMIGLYISPWLANYILISMDEAILAHKGVDETRYMDDVVVFANSKKDLHAVFASVKIALSKLRLKMKRNYTIAKFDYIPKHKFSRMRRTGKSLDFMGFVFFRDRVIIRKHIMTRCCNIARKFSDLRKDRKLYYAKHVRSLLSLIGWFTHTDTYDQYCARIKPYIRIKHLKQIISQLDKRRNNNARMEKRGVFFEAV